MIFKKLLSSAVAVSCLGLLLSSATSASAAEKSLLQIKGGDRIIIFGASLTYFASHNPNGYINLMQKKFQADHPKLKVEVINAGACNNNIDPAEKLPPTAANTIQLVSAGVCGSTVTEAESRTQKVIDYKPNMIIITDSGINDCWHFRPKRNRGVSIEDFKMEFPKFINALKTSHAELVVCTPTMLYEKKNDGNPWDKQFPQYIQVITDTAKRSHLPVIDVHSEFKNYLNTHNPEDLPKGVLTTDGVHFNDKGDELMAKVLLKAFGE